MGVIGLAFFIGKDRDQPAIAGVEIEVAFVRIVEVGLIENEGHAQHAFPEIYRCLTIRPIYRDVMHTLGLDFSEFVGLRHGLPPFFFAQLAPDQSTSFDL
jgi:hypothetical protein